MGTDKALLPWDGQPLWRRQREVLQQAGAAEIFLSVRPEQTWVPPDALVVRDETENAGPLAGIAAALARCRHSHLIVLAVDLPRMEVAWFQRLASQCRPGAGAVGQGEKFFEPLAAIYPRELLPLANAALARGEYSLQRLIIAAVAAGVVQDRKITAGEQAWFANWNSPDDAAATR